MTTPPSDDPPSWLASSAAPWTTPDTDSERDPSGPTSKNIEADTSAAQKPDQGDGPQRPGEEPGEQEADTGGAAALPWNAPTPRVDPADLPWNQPSAPASVPWGSSSGNPWGAPAAPAASASPRDTSARPADASTSEPGGTAEKTPSGTSAWLSGSPASSQAAEPDAAAVRSDPVQDVPAPAPDADASPTRKPRRKSARNRVASSDALASETPDPAENTPEPSALPKTPDPAESTPALSAPSDSRDVSEASVRAQDASTEDVSLASHAEAVSESVPAEEGTQAEDDFVRAAPAEDVVPDAPARESAAEGASAERASGDATATPAGRRGRARGEAGKRKSDRPFGGSRTSWGEKDASDGRRRGRKGTRRRSSDEDGPVHEPSGEGPERWGAESDAEAQSEGGGAREREPADPEARAREICLRMLTGSPRTRAQLADALRRKEIPEDVAEHVLGRFTDVGLIDDEAFAQMWVRSRHSGRGLGKRALAAELRQRGIDQEIVTEAVESLDSEQEELRARDLVRRKLSSTRGVERTKRVRRLVGMLARKGYPAGMAYRVVKDALEAEGTDLEDFPEDWGLD